MFHPDRRVAARRFDVPTHAVENAFPIVSNAQSLFTHASEPKQFVVLPNATHNDMLRADVPLYEQSLSDFLRHLEPESDHRQTL